MIIFSFDPGKTTGVAWYDTETEVFGSAQLTVEEIYEFVDEHCERIEFAQIERFVITERTIKAAREDEPMDVIGYLKYAAWRCGFKVGWSLPADVMQSFPDAALRKAGMFARGMDHANDAARHLAWHLVKNKYKKAGEFLV